MTEEIQFGRRGLGYLYIFFMVVFVVIGILFLMASLGMAIDKEDRSIFNIAAFAIGGLTWILGAPSMWGYWKSYSQNRVRIGPETFAIRTPAGKAYEIPYRNITAVAYRRNWRIREVVIETKDAVYKFDMNACPKPATVAKLVAERAGVRCEQIK